MGRCALENSVVTRKFGDSFRPTHSESGGKPTTTKDQRKLRHLFAHPAGGSRSPIGNKGRLGAVFPWELRLAVK